MAEINNNKPPPVALPQALPLGSAAQRTIDFNRNKQRNLANQRAANRLHEPAVRSNRSAPENRRSADLREQDKSATVRNDDNFADNQALGGDEPRTTTRQSAQPTVRQDRSEFASGPPTLNAYVAPPTTNPTAQTRAATQARYTSPEHRRGTATTGASTRSGYEGAAEQLVAMNGEQSPRAFVDMVRSRQAPAQQGSEAKTTEGHEVAREEHAEAQVQTSLISATNAAQAEHAPFSKSCVAAATQAALLGMGPTLRKDLLTGAHQRSVFRKGAAPDGDTSAEANGPVDRIVNFQTGQVTFPAQSEDEKVDWL